MPRKYPAVGNIVAKRLQLSYFEDNIPHYLRKQKKETLFTSKVSVPCSMEDVSQNNLGSQAVATRPGC